MGLTRLLARLLRIFGDKRVLLPAGEQQVQHRDVEQLGKPLLYQSPGTVPLKILRRLEEALLRLSDPVCRFQPPQRRGWQLTVLAKEEVAQAGKRIMHLRA